MATYILVSLSSTEAAVDAAVNTFIPAPNRLSLEPGKWLLTSPLATSKEVADQLGLTATTTFIICPIRGYFGRTRPDVWEWLGAKSSV